MVTIKSQISLISPVNDVNKSYIFLNRKMHDLVIQVRVQPKRHHTLPYLFRIANYFRATSEAALNVLTKDQKNGKK